MINDILFTEKQRFNQWWAWAIVIGINLIFLFGLVKQVFLGAQFGNNPLSNIGIILFLPVFYYLPFYF
ncbi:MAG: hypothetical protein IPP48_00460 [Chitinophagaceae bacterium]|nr:hypothetical protein [Chitinophagaceae bacterium]